MNTLRSPRLRVRLLAGIAAVLLTVSACGDDSDDPDDTTTSGSSADSDTGSTAGSDPAAEPAGDAAVSVLDIENFATVLVDAEGNTLYTTEAEDDGSVKCVDGCADFWPPVAADAGSVPDAVDGVSGEFGVVERPDGSTQLTLDGNPLYTFADDTGPGSFIGDGFEDDFQGSHFVWHAVTTDS